MFCDRKKLEDLLADWPAEKHVKFRTAKTIGLIKVTPEGAELTAIGQAVWASEQGGKM